jgi:hypothetical protein
MSGKPHNPNALPRDPLSRKLGGPKSQAERFAEEKNSPPGFRLSCPGCRKRRNLYKTVVVKSEKMSDTSTILKRILNGVWYHMKRIRLAQNRDKRLANMEIGAYDAIRQW